MTAVLRSPLPAAPAGCQLTRSDTWQPAEPPLSTRLQPHSPAMGCRSRLTENARNVPLKTINPTFHSVEQLRRGTELVGEPRGAGLWWACPALARQLSPELTELLGQNALSESGCGIAIPQDGIYLGGSQSKEELLPSAELATEPQTWTRRGVVLMSALAVAAAGIASPGKAIASAEGDDGLVRFYKPDGRERPTDPYSFLLPPGWLQEFVSLNDAKLYGLDLRASGPQGSLDVLVLPVGNGDKETVEDIGDTDDVISSFGPSDQVALVTDSSVEKVDGETYYFYELSSPRRLMSAYVCRSQLYVFVATSPPKQWRRVEAMLRTMRDSFRNEFAP